MAERSSRRRAEPAELFAVPAYPDGLRDHEDLIEPAQEAELLAAIAGLPFNEARYRSIRPNAGR